MPYVRISQSIGKMIKAILYDLDGVLVDATEWHYESLNAALKEVCGFIINRDEHVSTFNGIPTIKKLEILQNSSNIELAGSLINNGITEAKSLIAIPDG